MTHQFVVEDVKDATGVYTAGWVMHCTDCGAYGDLRERGETCLRDGFDHQQATKEVKV